MSRLCSAPGCTVPAPAGRCEAHRRPAWQASQPVHRTRGRALQRARWDLWVKDPHCQQCHRVILPSESIRDHIQNLRTGGLDTADNVQLLCLACHELKTQREAQRGREMTR